MISTATISELAQERIDELDNGCYLVDIHVDAANRIVVEVDNEKRGIAVEDCMSISRNIEHNLDREKEDFSLEVTSPGLDKPLRVWKQYRKNIGRQLKVKPVEGDSFEGTVVAADEKGVELTEETKKRVEGKKKKEKIIINHKLNYDQIAEAKVVIAFK